MAIYCIKKRKGVSVCISYTPPGESRVRESFRFVENGAAFGKRLAEAKREAEKALTRRRAEILEGRHQALNSRRRAPTFRDYVRDTYAPVLRRSGMKSRPRDAEIRRVTVGTLARHFGTLRLDEIKRSAVEAFVDARVREGAGPAGINRDLARLRHLLNDAADREELGVRLPRIPWRRIMMKEDPQHYRPMRDDEEPRLLAELRDPIVGAYVEVLLHTGIRPQAGLSLCWRHVDLERMVIAVTPEINKTGEYLVYLNSRVQEILRGLFAKRPEPLRQPDALVFAHRNGRPRRSIRTAWERACKSAGIEGLHVRGLRATAATRLQECGANTLDVGAHLGHSVKSLGVTARYVDPAEQHRRRIAERTIRHRPGNVIELRPREQHPLREGSTKGLRSGTLSTR